MPKFTIIYHHAPASSQLGTTVVEHVELHSEQDAVQHVNEMMQGLLVNVRTGRMITLVPVSQIVRVTIQEGSTGKTDHNGPPIL